MANSYSHWRTPKLEAELEAVKKLKGWQTKEHYPKANKGSLALEHRRYVEIESSIEDVLKKRKKR
jgi:hypothetical protein